MSRSPLIRVGVAALAGAAAAAGIIGVLVFVNADTGFAGCTAMTGFGWVVPLVAGGVIAVVAFALISNGPVGSAQEGTAPTQACCSQCGGIIRGDWRLCPHCGTRLT